MVDTTTAEKIQSANFYEKTREQNPNAESSLFDIAKILVVAECVKDLDDISKKKTLLSRFEEMIFQ